MVWYYGEVGSIWYSEGIWYDIMEGCGVYDYLFTIRYVCFDVFVCLRLDGWWYDRVVVVVYGLYVASVWVCDGIMIYGIWYMVYGIIWYI